MANYCFTNYCIEGNKSSLSKIANAINLTDGCVDNIFKILDEELEIQDYSQWCDAEVIDKDDYSVLMFREENKGRRSENIVTALELGYRILIQPAKGNMIEYLMTMKSHCNS